MTDTFWDAEAERYARKPVQNVESFERKIAITRSRMSAGSVVLDVGCGTGSLALRLAPDAGHVHGLDVSREMIRIARGKAEAQGVRNVTFHIGPFDRTFTVFELGTLDGICAYSIFHLLPDRVEALARVFELLKPGGFFVASTVCLKESWIPMRPLLWAMHRVGRAPKVAVFSKRSFAEDVRRTGFVDIAEPDVGANVLVSFLVATKPH